jgi:hypothetical protein
MKNSNEIKYHSLNSYVMRQVIKRASGTEFMIVFTPPTDRDESPMDALAVSRLHVTVVKATEYEGYEQDPERLVWWWLRTTHTTAYEDIISPSKDRIITSVFVSVKLGQETPPTDERHKSMRIRRDKRVTATGSESTDPRYVSLFVSL